MITAIRIQNFKSIKDQVVHLNQMNLLIGANNSGKSNFLKAMDFLRQLIDLNYPDKRQLQRILFQHKDVLMTSKVQTPLAFSVFYRLDEYENRNYVFRIEIYSEEKNTALMGFTENKEVDLKFTLSNLDYLENTFDSYSFHAFNNEHYTLEPISNVTLEAMHLKKKQENSSDFSIYKQIDSGKRGGDHSLKYPWLQPVSRFDRFESILLNLFSGLQIYKPDPEKIAKPYPLESDERVNRDASNLVSFFDRMKDIKGEVIEQINKDLSKCIPEFKDLRFDTLKTDDPVFHELKRQYNRDTFKKLGVADKTGQIYWAEDLSEGALYFIALLAIIHQPNPPKLLLLEEPEKGIHPSRITEVIYYIEKLAEEKNIQIIITTHSPIVLDQFAHDPSSVLVFDKEDYASIIRSMESIITEKKKKTKKVAAVNYEEELSENWLMGLLNGIPND